MAYDLPNQAPLPEAERPHVWLERLLLAAFLLCVLIGLLALVTWWSLRETQAPPADLDPLTAIRTELIRPELALRQLAGDAADGLANQAIVAGYLETARAILAYDPGDSGQGATPHMTRLALLARRYQETGDAATAAHIYQMMLAPAVLDVTIPSLERGQLLVQAAEGLLASGNRAAALDAAQQAQRVATQAPDLLPVQRSQILEPLRSLVDQLEDPALAATVDDLARNPYLSPEGTLIPSRRATFSQLLPYDDPTQAAIEARQQAARLLADRIALTGGVDIDPERQALAQALLAEDQARMRFYDAARTGEVSLSQQTWLLLDRIAWLATQVRVAQGNFGLPLVPAWEQQAQGLVEQLGAAYGEIAAVLDAHAAAQATPLDQALQRVENQLWLAQQIERGLYATLAIADQGERIRIVQDDAIRQGAQLAFPIALDPDALPPGMRIQPR
jgi:hypothetical protein